MATTFNQLLDLLTRGEGTLSATQLARLSGLEGTRLAALTERWARIPAERRAQLLRQLNELAEDNVELDFEAVMRLGLDDADAAVRVAAIDGLWEATDRRLADRFIEILRHDGDTAVRAAAASALGKFVLMAELDEFPAAAAQRVRAALLEAWHDEDEEIAVRARVIEAIGACSEETIQDLIGQAYASPDRTLRLSSLFAMGRSADTRWLPTLRAEMNNTDPEFRNEAVCAAGAIESEEIVGDVIRLTADADTTVRLSAIDALGQIGGKRAKETLRRLAMASDPVISSAAEDALDTLNFADDMRGFFL